MLRRLGLILLVLLVAIFYGTNPARAQGNVVTLESGRTIDDDFYAAGQLVTIRGHVNRDLMAAGYEVFCSGHVDGDLLAAGRTVHISGAVNGNVRAAGQDLTIETPVGRALTAFAQRLTIGPGTTVGQNLLYAGETLNLAGQVHGHARAWVNTATISGRIGGNLEIGANSLDLLPGAEVAGDVIVTGPNPPRIAEGAQVKGQVKYMQTAPEQPARAVWWQVLGEKLLSLVKLLGLAFLLALVAAPFLRAETEVLRQKTWVTLGTGLGWLVLAPLAILLLTVAVVGQSVAGVLTIAYLGLIFLAALLFKPVLGAWLGQYLLTRFGGTRKFSLLWETLLGATLVWLVALIPVLGAIVTLVGVMFILGSWMVLLARHALSWPAR